MKRKLGLFLDGECCWEGIVPAGTSRLARAATLESFMVKIDASQASSESGNRHPSTSGILVTI